MNQSIMNEILEVYNGLLERIDRDFQNRADAKAVAAQLTNAYFNVAALPTEPIESPTTFKGGLNGNKYK